MTPIEAHREKRPAQTRVLDPNFIGATYRVAHAHAATAGTGTSPRMHWRRGHWRQQPYGSNRSLRRDTWIEPMLVNGEGS